MIDNLFLVRIEARKKRIARQERRIKKLLAAAIVTGAAIVSLGVGIYDAQTQETPVKVEAEAAARPVLHTVFYTVKEGDTLEGIAEHFIVRNTYARREIKEFAEGIVEINECLWETREVEPGQKLKVKYWTKAEK